MTPEERFSQFLLANNDAQGVMGVRDAVSPWAGSPFEWMMQLPSRSRGKAGEELASAWLRRLGHDVMRARNAGHDRVIDGRTVEMKMSTLWAQGAYVFQQLRNQDYEFVLLLGISPAIAHAWFMPKATALQRSVPQHGGQVGTDTRWLSFPAAHPPMWLSEYGGDLSACVQVFSRMLRD